MLGEVLEAESGRTRHWSAEDWGIESDNELRMSSDEESDDPRTEPRINFRNDPRYDPNDPDASRREQYARDRMHSGAPYMQRLRPRLLGGHRTFSKEAQFRSIVRALLNQRLTPQETARFTEQFRYIIIGSGLLEAQPVLTTWSMTSNQRRKRLLFDKSPPWTHLYINPATTVGGGGMIGLLGVYLHRRYRAATTRTEKSAVALVIFVLVVVYMYATARRRLVRGLRERVLVLAEDAVQAAKRLDGDLVRLLRELQDVEALGSKSQSSPVGLSLRATLGSAIHLVSESLEAALRDCVVFAVTSRFDQFLEIYNLRQQLPEVGVTFTPSTVGEQSAAGEQSTEGHSEDATRGSLDAVFTPRTEATGSAACYVATSELRASMRRVHTLRRLVLCALLSIDADGAAQEATANQGVSAVELAKWTTVADTLRHLAGLAENVSRVTALERCVPVAESTLRDADGLEGPDSPARSGLSEVLAQVKRLGARLDLASESEGGNYAFHVQAAKDEMGDLLTQWRAFECAYDEHGERTVEYNQSSMVPSPSNLREFGSFNVLPGTLFDRRGSSLSSPTLIMTPELSQDTFPADAASLASTDVSVIEGEVPAVLPKVAPKLGREERIELAKRARQAPKVREPSLVQELTNVLDMRRMGQ